MQNHQLPSPLKILVFSSNPSGSDRLRIDREVRDIQDALRGEAQVEVHPAGRAEDLRRLLLEHAPHIVHFSGHGTVNEELLLEDAHGDPRRVDKEALVELFRLCKKDIRLVLLNACHSEPLAEAISEHIDFAVGMGEPIEDHAANKFSVAFYQAIAQDVPVTKAFAIGCNALQLEGAASAHVPRLFARVPLPPPPAPPPPPTTITRSRNPVQILLVLDLISDNAIAVDELDELIPPQRSERHVLSLSEFGARPGPLGSAIDFEGCAEALVRMVVEARRRLPTDGRPVRYYVAGRAALPVFAHLGMELTSWADVTLLNRRKDHRWDVLPLAQGASKPEGPRFFKIVNGLDLHEPSEADGRVAVFISTGYAPQRAEMRAFLQNHGSSVAGLVEVRAEHGVTAILDGNNAAQAMSELAHVFERLPDAYPRRRGLAIFVAGPTTLAFMVGRAINVNPIVDVWVPNFASLAYHFAATLPWAGAARVSVPAGADHELERRRIVTATIDRIQSLQRSLRVEHLPPSLSEKQAEKFLARLQSIVIHPEPGGDAFELVIVERRMSLGKGLLEALRAIPEAERGRVGQSLFLHELFHFDQNLNTATYRGIGRAGVALEDADYWADAMTVATLTRWEVGRGGEEGKERSRDIAVASLDAVLAGIEAFDRFEQGGRLQRLYERRLRRYLIWHLQRVRALALSPEQDIWQLLGKRLIVELAPLRGHLDARGDKVVDGPLEDPEVFVALDGRIARSRSVEYTSAVILEAVRAYDRETLARAMRAVREQHLDLLVPWSR